jgi:hypothetical protein
MKPDSGRGLNGVPIASAVFCHTLFEVKSDIESKDKVGWETHLFPHQLSSIPSFFGIINVKNITIVEIAMPASRATERI